MYTADTSKGDLQQTGDADATAASAPLRLSRSGFCTPRDRHARLDAAIPIEDQLMVNCADAATSYGVVSFLFNCTT